MSLERTQQMRARLPNIIEQQSLGVQLRQNELQIASLEPGGVMIACSANAIPGVNSLVAIVCSLFAMPVYTCADVLSVVQETNGAWVRLRATIMDPDTDGMYHDYHLEMHGMPLDGLVHDCLYLMGHTYYADRPRPGVMEMRQRRDLVTDVARADRLRQALQLSFERGMYVGQMFGAVPPPDPAEAEVSEEQAEITREEIVGAVTQLVRNVGQPVFGPPRLGASAALEAAQSPTARPPMPTIEQEGDSLYVRNCPELDRLAFRSAEDATLAMQNTHSWAVANGRAAPPVPRSSCIPDRPTTQNSQVMADAGTYTRDELRRAMFAVAYGRQTPLDSDEDESSLGAMGSIGTEVPPVTARSIDARVLTPMPFDRPAMSDPANRQPPVDEISLDVLDLPDDSPLRRSLERAYQAMDTYLRSAPPHASVAVRMRRTFQSYLQNTQANIEAAEQRGHELDPVGVENAIHILDQITNGNFTILGGPNRSSRDLDDRPQAVASVAARLRREAFARRTAAGDRNVPPADASATIFEQDLQRARVRAAQRARQMDPPTTVRPASFTPVVPQDASALPTARRIRIRNQELKHGDTGKRDEPTELDPSEDHPPSED